MLNCLHLHAVYVSGQSGGSDIITEEASNMLPTKADTDADNGNSAIVIQVSDTDSEASKGKHIGLFVSCFLTNILEEAF